MGLCKWTSLRTAMFSPISFCWNLKSSLINKKLEWWAYPLKMSVFHNPGLYFSWVDSVTWSCGPLQSSRLNAVLRPIEEELKLSNCFWKSEFLTGDAKWLKLISDGFGNSEFCTRCAKWLEFFSEYFWNFEFLTGGAKWLESKLEGDAIYFGWSRDKGGCWYDIPFEIGVFGSNLFWFDFDMVTWAWI